MNDGGGGLGQAICCLSNAVVVLSHGLIFAGEVPIQFFQLNSTGSNFAVFLRLVSSEMATTSLRLASSLGGGGILSLTFHQPQPVRDHEDSELQPVFEHQEVPYSGPCCLGRMPAQESESGNSNAFLLPMECE